MPRRAVIPFVPHMSVGLAVPSGKPLRELYGLFMQSAWFQRLSPKSQSGHRTTVLKLGTLPDFPSNLHVQAWKARMLVDVTEGTAQFYCWNLQRVYEWGATFGVSQGNPVKACEFRIPPPAPRAIRRIGMAWPQVLAAMPCDRSRAFAAVLRFLGLRKGEALGLVAADVLDDARWLTVTRQRPAEASWLTSELKGGYKSHRTLPVPSELRPMLRKVVGLGPAHVWVGKGGQERATVPYLFPFRGADLVKLRALLKAALPLHFGIGNAWHVLRHSLAAEMGDAGASAADIQPILGHASPETTTHYMSALVGQRVRADAFQAVQRMRKEVRPEGRPRKVETPRRRHSGNAGRPNPNSK